MWVILAGISCITNEDLKRKVFFLILLCSPKLHFLISFIYVLEG